MNTLKFKYIAAENFICIEHIEIDLTKESNVVLIRGENQDVGGDEEERLANNGVGKSTIPEIIVYTLYGKTIKSKLSHKNVIHNKVGKKLTTEVRWDDYRVVRTRKPDSLRIWKSAEGIWDKTTELSLGGMPATEKYIRDQVGLSYETFTSVVVFTDDNRNSFLESDTPGKRNIVENLLGLSIYKEYAEVAKDFKNKLKAKILDATREFQTSITTAEIATKHLDQVREQDKHWKTGKEAEIKSLANRIEQKQNELRNTSFGVELEKYEKAQEKIKSLTSQLTDLEEKYTKNNDALVEGNKKFDVIRNKHFQLNTEIQTTNAQIKQANDNISKSNAYVASLKSKKDSKCNACFGVVKEENFSHLISQEEENVENFKKQITELTENLNKLSEPFKDLDEKYKKLSSVLPTLQSNVNKLSTAINNARNEIRELTKINKPEIGTVEQVIAKQIEEYERQIIEKKAELAGPSPLVKIIQMAEEDLASKTKDVETKKSLLKQKEDELPYYEFWVKAFGDTGIRKFVVDGIIPALNSRIAYWMQFLIDNKISLKFDNQLEETIERNPADGDPFVYFAMSGGERRRLNLSVSQAFAYIMMISSGTSPSVVFLDEVTSNIDQNGVQGVYNMIMELSKTKQVFVTTHDLTLLEMLNGCDTIYLVKKNGFTTRADKL